MPKYNIILALFIIKMLCMLNAKKIDINTRVCSFTVIVLCKPYDHTRPTIYATVATKNNGACNMNAKHLKTTMRL